MKKIFTLLLLTSAIVFANGQLIKSDFLTGYKVGDPIEKGAYAGTTQGAEFPIMVNQWNLSGKTGTNDQSGANPLAVAPLVYTGYAESGKDVAIDLLKLETGGRTTIHSLASDYTYGPGTYYLAFMTNVTAASLTSGQEYLAFDGNYTANGQRARLTVKAVDETTFQFGLGDGSAASTFIATPFNFGQTYFMVLKVTLNPNESKPTEGNGTGTAWLYINPEISTTEPTEATQQTAISGTALKSIRGVTVRQRSTLAAQIGGFRFANSWADAIGTTTGVSKVTMNNSQIKAIGKTIFTGDAGSIRVFNTVGAELINQRTQGSLDTQLNKGFYVVRFADETGKVSSNKIFID